MRLYRSHWQSLLAKVVQIHADWLANRYLRGGNANRGAFLSSSNDAGRGDEQRVHDADVDTALLR
jgi:hypothetical protein